MLLMGNKSSNFFDIKNAHNSQTRLKALVNAPHDMPVSSTTLKDRIMGLISNDEDDDDDSLIDNHQGNLAAAALHTRNTVLTLLLVM